MDLSNSDSKDSFERFMDASNEDEESLTLKQSIQLKKGGGVGDVQHSQQLGSGSSGMGFTYGAYSGDPYGGLDFESLKAPEKYTPKPKPKPKQKAPQVRAPAQRDSALERSSRVAGKGVRQLEDKDDEDQRASSRSKSPPLGTDEADRAGLSDSESVSASLPNTTDLNAADGAASGGSIFASMAADFQKSVANMAEEMKQEEERIKKEQEERRRQEEEQRRQEEEEEMMRKEEAEKRRQEEEERLQKEEEERKKREQEEEEKRRKEAEEEKRRKEEEEEKERKRQEEERLKQEQEARRLEEIRKQEEAKRRKEEAEEEAARQKKKKEEEDAKLKAEQEQREIDEENRRAEMEEVARREREHRRREEERMRHEAASLRQEQERKMELLRKAEATKSREQQEQARRQGDIQQQERHTSNLESSSRGTSPSIERTRRNSEAVPLDGYREACSPSPRPSVCSSETHQELPSLARQRIASGDLGDPAASSLQNLRKQSLGEGFGQAPDLLQDSQKPWQGEEGDIRQGPGEQTPKLRLPDGGALQRNRFPNASAGSGPLIASVAYDSMGSLPGFSSQFDGNAVEPTPDHKSFNDDRWRLPCDDGKLLLLKSTESAEMEEKLAFFRAHGLDQSGCHQESAAAPVGSPVFDLTSSLLLDPTVNSDMLSLAGLRRSDAARSETQQSFQGDIVQRMDRAKLQALQAEIDSLKKKISVMEEYNKDLASNRSHAEAESARVGEQVMWLRLENRKLEDSLQSKSTALREAALERHELEQKLRVCEGLREELSAESTREATAAKKKQDEMESRIAALAVENAGLREECEGLKEDLFGAPVGLQQRRISAADGTERGSDGDDLQNEVVRLQSELQMTETMLRGTEKENENLAQQNRSLRQNARLRKEEIDGRQLQLVAELNAARASADTNPASMRRVGELERELMTAKERCEEMAKEVERCREAKRQLERELLNGPPAVTSADTSAQLAEAVAERSRLESEVTSLHEKLDWYVESQRKMEDDRQSAIRLGEDIRSLRAENAELKRRPGTKETNRRTAELQKQVEQLTESLRKRNPDSILNLMKACEPKPEEKKELRTLTAKVEELETKLNERDQTYDRQVRALRAHYDHLRLEYEKRAGSGVDTGTADATATAGREDVRHGAPDREAVLKARIHDLERQVEHTKSYYLTKLRKREPLVPALPKRNAKSGAEQREMELHLQVRERDARIEALTKDLHFRNMDEAAKPVELGTGTASSSTAPSPSSLRLFLACPEAPPIASISSELRVMGHWERQRCYDEIASQAKHMVATLASEEAAAGILQGSASHAPLGGRNVLRIHTQPPLSAAVWSVWRRCAEQIASLAAEACLRSEDGSTGGDGVQAQVSSALAKFRGSLDTVLFHLLFAPTGLTNSVSYPEAWSSDTGGIVESLLPRVMLERFCEDLHASGPGHVVGALQDVEVHADADRMFRWSELEGVLSRCGIGGPKLVNECRRAAHPDWALSLAELQQILRADGDQRTCQAPCSGLIRTLTRIRLTVADHDPSLHLLFRSLDPAGRGFISRAEFMEALRGIHCAVSVEERGQLATFFSPAVDPRVVCYPLFLQSIVPVQGEGARLQTTWPQETLRPLHERWADPVASHGGLGRPTYPSAAHFDSAARASELEVENSDLRERVRVLTEKCAESASMAAQSPAHVVRRLQGDMAALETRMLEQQTALSAGSRKAEITLRGELDVARHEVVSLRQTLETKDADLERYKHELEQIIEELMVMKTQNGM